jgi:hypothetical protein
MGAATQPRANANLGARAPEETRWSPMRSLNQSMAAVAYAFLAFGSLPAEAE